MSQETHRMLRNWRFYVDSIGGLEGDKYHQMVAMRMKPEEIEEMLAEYRKNRREVYPEYRKLIETEG